MGDSIYLPQFSYNGQAPSYIISNLLIWNLFNLHYWHLSLLSGIILHINIGFFFSIFDLSKLTVLGIIVSFLREREMYMYICVCVYRIHTYI